MKMTSESMHTEQHSRQSASTLYIRSSASQREAAGVYDDMIRVSIGIEDLIEDFIQEIRKGMTPENQA